MALRFNTIMRALLAGNSTPSVPSFYFNFSNPSNVTLGAAQARGNITSTQNAHITMSASLSRVVGVAPLYVNIDMTGTTSDLTANATHDLFYSVNWGDSGAGQWANGVQSPGLTDKNWSFGPVGGHVFETPGTYLVTPTSTDGVNSAAKPGYVTVLDPNVVYDPAYDSAANGYGHETICISSSGNFTGAPGTYTPINTAGNTDMYAAWNTYKASNKRILFCKADNWTCSAPVNFLNKVRTTIGGYGTGVARAFGSGTLVNVDAQTLSGNMFLIQSGCSDIRIGEMKVLGSYLMTGFASGDSYTQMLLHKMEFRGVYAGYSINPGNNIATSDFDQNCLYEMLCDDLFGYVGALGDTPRATTSATAGVLTSVGHPFKEGYRMYVSGTLPAPLVASTFYWIAAAGLTANTFALSAAPGGSPITVTTDSASFLAYGSGMGGGMGAYFAATRGGMMGCYFDNHNYGEQTVRIPYLDRAHINNNYIARPNQGKNIVKIHSFAYDTTANQARGDLLGRDASLCYTEKVVFSGNVMSLRGGYSLGDTSIPGTPVVNIVGSSFIACGNGGTGNDERVRNVIFENNITYGCLGVPKNAMNFIGVSCPNVTVRNNIYDVSFGDRTTAYSSGSGTEINFATVNSSTADPTIGVRIYNNTLYSNLSVAQRASFVITSIPGIRAPVDGLVVKNNLWYLPFYVGAYKQALLERDTGHPATNVTVSNNADTVAGGSPNTSPGFVATPPIALTDWRATAAWTIGSGATVPVLRDFNNASRYGSAYSLGAVLP